MFAFIRKLTVEQKDTKSVKKGKSTSTISELVVGPNVPITNQSYSDVDYLPMKAEILNHNYQDDCYMNPSIPK